MVEKTLEFLKKNKVEVLFRTRLMSVADACPHRELTTTTLTF